MSKKLIPSKPIPPLVPSLTGAGDFDSWKLRIKITLYDCNCWANVVEGDSDGTDMMVKVRAYAFIFHSISPVLIGQFTNVPEFDPKALWKAVCERYESKSTANKVGLIVQLLTQKLDKNEEIDILSGRIRMIESKLRQLDVVVDDALLQFALYRSLPDQYRAMTDSLATQKDMSYELAVTHLKGKQQSDVFMNHQNKKEVVDGTAMFVASKKSFKKSQYQE